MRKPVVDYRDFRLSKLNEPRFRHLQYLAGWIVYFTLYFLTEAFIPVEKCYVVHGALDDVIPFCEYFIVPYVGWYLLVVASLLYFMLYNPDNFKNLSKFIIYTLIWNEQELIWYINDLEVFRTSNFMPQEAMYPMVNSFIAEGKKAGEADFEIDYIKVYSKR